MESKGRAHSRMPFIAVFLLPTPHHPAQRTDGTTTPNRQPHKERKNVSGRFRQIKRIFGRSLSVSPFAIPEFPGPEAKSDAPSLLRSRQHGLIRVDRDFVRARRRREPESRFVAIGEHPAQKYRLLSRPHAV